MFNTEITPAYLTLSTKENIEGIYFETNDALPFGKEEKMETYFAI